MSFTPRDHHRLELAARGAMAIADLAVLRVAEDQQEHSMLRSGSRSPTTHSSLTGRDSGA